MKSTLFFVLVCFLMLTGCGPTLTRTSLGWKFDGEPFTIEPTTGGQVMPSGWVMDNYEVAGKGFRKRGDDPRELALKRTEDDGVLVLVSDHVSWEDQGKKLEALAERWLRANVMNPDSDSDRRFEDVVPPLDMKTEVQSGLRFATGHTVLSRSVDVTSKNDFEVRNGAGFQLVANLIPMGATTPDRVLSLAFVRASNGSRLVIIAYANTPGMFPAGLEDAKDLAHRVIF